MLRLWQCSNCFQKFNWAQALPAQDLKACAFYGDYGRPPFNIEGYNNGPIIARFLYCEKCSR